MTKIKILGELLRFHRFLQADSLNFKGSLLRYHVEFLFV